MVFPQRWSTAPSKQGKVPGVKPTLGENYSDVMKELPR
jgi:hypothetical protein